MLNFCFLTPKRHILARNRVVWRITRENRFRGLGCRPLEEPQKRSPVNILMRKFAHTGKRNALRDRDKILHVSRYPWHNHVCNFLWRSIKGFGRGKGSNFQFSHWFASSPLQHSRTTVRVCYSKLYVTYGMILCLVTLTDL